MSEFVFKLTPMEGVDQVVESNSFDAAYVHQALHHVYDWKAALTAAFRTLKPGGWMIIADEPNVLHTFISYRMGKLSQTHEIGMSRRQIIRCLRDAVTGKCARSVRDSAIVYTRFGSLRANESRKNQPRGKFPCHGSAPISLASTCVAKRKRSRPAPETQLGE